MSVNFSNPDQESPLKVSFLYLEDGKLIDNTWITGRLLNGDEFRISFPSDRSRIFKLSLYQY